MGRCSCDGVERSIKMFLTYVFSHIGLCTCVAGYAVAGAFLFRWLEQKHVREHYVSVAHRNKCIEALDNITAAYPTAYAAGTFESRILADLDSPESDPNQWRQQAMDIVAEFEAGVVAAVEDGLYDQTPEAQREEWNIIGSLFFCVTVITTVGYGHIAPRTFEGKLSTIFYSVLGIPLFLLTLTNIGNSMASAFRFSYTKLCCCCVKKDDDDLEIVEPRESETGEPHPYIPYPKYAPKRKKMLISPPISATIHRGNDVSLIPVMKGRVPKTLPKISTSSSPSPIYSRSNPLALSPEALEARKLVAECSAYASSHIPGYVADPADMAYDPNQLEQTRQFNANTNHDYDLINNTLLLEPPTPSLSTTSPTQSTPSSPVSRDVPVESWSTSREGRGLSVTYVGGLVPEGGSISNQSTRPASPSWLSPSSVSPRTESAVTWADEDPNYSIEGKALSRPPGKTLVVYNTMSGDALKQQSKLARRMAAMHSKKHRGGMHEESTLFMDPVTGQSVHGDMMGLDIRPIPPDAQPKDVRVPIPIVLGFVACYIMVGALLFQWLEGWSLSDAAYFCFITLSTIGFGDFVPGKALGYKTRTAQLKLVASSLYLLFGLAVLAMSFNLVQEEVVLKCKSVAQYVGLMKE